MVCPVGFLFVSFTQWHPLLDHIMDTEVLLLLLLFVFFLSLFLEIDNMKVTELKMQRDTRLSLKETKLKTRNLIEVNKNKKGSVRCNVSQIEGSFQVGFEASCCTHLSEALLVDTILAL